MNSTDTTASPTAPVTITDQRGTSATFPYAVTLRDAHGHVCGIGYGQTPHDAYAEARQNFIEDRLSETRAMRRGFDVAMVEQVIQMTGL